MSDISRKATQGMTDIFYINIKHIQKNLIHDWRYLAYGYITDKKGRTQRPF
jgi:hypothetical protein